MLSQINQIIACSCTLMLLIFTLFIFTSSKRKELNKSLLLFFLLVNASFLTGYLIKTNIGFISLFWLTCFLLFHISALLFGPLLFYYSKSILSKNFELNKRDAIHLIPFTACLIFIIIKYLLSNSVWILDSERQFYTFLINIHILLYLVFRIHLINKHKTEIKNYYSSITGVDYRWLTLVLVGFAAMWLIDFLHYVIGHIVHLSSIIHSALGTFSLAINFIFTIVLYYEGLRQPGYFHKIEIKDTGFSSGKFKLSENDSSNYLSKVQAYMRLEKPYLNQSLTINEFSEAVNIPVRFISYVINDSLHQNFFDFVNTYRIEESKKYLSDPKSEKMTVLEILYLTGFNSKSTFNKVFKDHTGFTPTQFKRQNLKNPAGISEKIV